ncbi:MAG: hypothetical protein JJV93_02980 [Alphaproteobacteria bacterium]|nr:hypothetical protein [Alphaproteobacteria bacterium]
MFKFLSSRNLISLLRKTSLLCFGIVLFYGEVVDARSGISSRSSFSNARSVTTDRSAGTPTSMNTETSNQNSWGYSNITMGNNLSCKNTVFNCMNDICKFPDNQGRSCACSSRYDDIKIIKEKAIAIQKEADEVLNVQVEKEKLGIKADLIFRDDKEEAVVSSSSMVADMMSNNFSSFSLDTFGDDDQEDKKELLGTSLYNFAKNKCNGSYKKCKADEETLEVAFLRQIQSDCDTYEAFVNSQLDQARENLKMATKALQQVRLDTFDTFNKYNRGECTVLYTDCVAEQTDCGIGFQNCSTKKQLDLKRVMCDDILGECIAYKKDVVQDFYIFVDERRIKYAKNEDIRMRQSCLQNVDLCLEEHCQINQRTACVNSLEMALNVCPVITQCEQIIGTDLIDVVEDKLSSLQANFCQEDIKDCLTDRCGEGWNNPACMSASVEEILEMCPSNKIATCRGNRSSTSIFLKSLAMNMSHSRLKSCEAMVNKKIYETCGENFQCIRPSVGVETITDEFIKNSSISEQTSMQATEQYKEQLEKETKRIYDMVITDQELKTCSEQSNQGSSFSRRDSFKDNTYLSAVYSTIYMRVEREAYYNYTKTLAKMSSILDVNQAEQKCIQMQGVGGVISAVFDKNTRLCRTCRKDKLCETAGNAKKGAMIGATSGAVSGATMGSAGGPWGSAIGAGVGLIAGGLLGGKASKEKEFCTELRPCEEIKM